MRRRSRTWLAGVGVDAAVGGPDDVADADIVCTCTTSDVPLFDGGLLGAGRARERRGQLSADDAGARYRRRVLRARVVVETRDAAFAEAGELCIPIDEGAFGRDHVVADLAQVDARRRGPHVRG